MQEIAVFLGASETHNRKNINKTIDETLAAFEETIPPRASAGHARSRPTSRRCGAAHTRATSIPSARVEIAVRLVEMGCYQISLGRHDRLRHPRQTQRIIELMAADIPLEKLALHMHDTRGTALANVLVGLELGIRDLRCVGRRPRGLSVCAGSRG